MVRKRGGDEEAEFKAWSIPFKTSFDYLGDLPASGVTPETFRAEAQKAWKRFGARYMQQWLKNPSQTVPWALSEFGEP